MSSAAHRSLPPAADSRGEALHLRRLTGTLYCRSELTAPWGIDLPSIESCMMFHVVTTGHCWLEAEGAEPRLLQNGSVALVPHGAGHTLRSGPQADAESLFDIPVEQVSERYEIMRHGGGGHFTHLICGVVPFDHVAARTHLRDTSEPLSVLAGHLGYQSEAAFCRAFKRVCGVPPGAVRRAGGPAA